MITLDKRQIIKIMLFCHLMTMSLGALASAPMPFEQAVEIMSKVHKPITLQTGNSRAAVLAEFQGRVGDIC